ncbi:MAG TPA: sulfite exporter TauE/SafE family protein [Solirubrobacteraceae bacterium]|nr:sulfite exporter TauE/SafE family protein [Solirubrobacteraceae bacterium]
MTTSSILLLVGFGLIAGLGITAVGPGGVFATVGLFLVSGRSPAVIAGTAIATHLATGGLGSLAYHRSGELRRPETRRVAGLLMISAAIGTPLGVLINSFAPARLFGILLALFLVAIAALVWLRSARIATGGTHPHHSAAFLVALGTGIAIAGGMFGVGGPLLTVPLLLLAGTPVLSALGAAQAQSIVVAGMGTLGYLIRGTIDPGLVAIVGIPELCGVLVGWRLAQALPERTLTRALIAALFASAGLVLVHGSISPIRSPRGIAQIRHVSAIR